MARFRELCYFLANTNDKPDVVCISGTFLKPVKVTPRFDGYTVFRKDRPTPLAGDLIMLLNIDIDHTPFQLDDIADIELQGIKLCTDRGSIRIVNVYIKPQIIVPKTHNRKSIFRQEMLSRRGTKCS